MNALLGIVALVAGIAFLEIPGLWRKHQFKELGMFIFILALGTVISCGLCLKLPMPNPMDWIGDVFRPLSQLTDTILS
ncbi:hypothetical protein ACX1C1_01075 [Paenibacillus sp. strain BS8-2]